MAFKKEKQEEGFKFPPQARLTFAKEIAKHNFDFDSFLKSKEALRRQFETVNGNTFPVLVAIENETPEQQSAYMNKHINNTSYYSFEIATESKVFKVPFGFWSELREQSRVEESRVFWEETLAENQRTGTDHRERARAKMKELYGAMEFLNNSLKYK